jgi:hypothetical protein
MVFKIKVRFGSVVSILVKLFAHKGYSRSSTRVLLPNGSLMVDPTLNLLAMIRMASSCLYIAALVSPFLQ